MSVPLRNDSQANARTLIPLSNPNPVESFLARLDLVRKAGRGWTAKCPAHEDRTASLSITAGDDGRVLLHCFAGCSAADVVASAGLTIGDLFVKRPTSDMTFAERSALREQGRQAQWRAALNVMSLEAKIIQLAAHDLLTGKPLAQDDRQRLVVACGRIDAAQEVLRVRD